MDEASSLVCLCAVASLREEGPSFLTSTVALPRLTCSLPTAAMDVDLARQYMQYKREQGLPTDQDNCLYFIHFLLEQELPSNGVMWVSKEANQGIFHHAFQVIDKGAFARKYGILSDGKTIPKYDSIRRLLNNYAFHCVRTLASL